MCPPAVLFVVRLGFAFLLAGFVLFLMAGIVSHYSRKLLALQLNHRPWFTLPKCDARTRLRYQLTEERDERLAFETIPSCLLTLLRITPSMIARSACLLFLRPFPLLDAGTRRAGWLCVAWDLRSLSQCLESLQLRLDQATVRLHRRPLRRWILTIATLDLLAELLVRLWQRLDRTSRRVGLASLAPDARHTEAAVAWNFLPWWDPARIPEAERIAVV